MAFKANFRMKQVFIYALFFFLICFLSCAAPGKIMSSWVGKTKAELYKSLGPPNNKTDDGQGGEILIYSSVINTGQDQGTLYNNGTGELTYTTPQKRQYSRLKMFYVNSKGIIYSWRLQEL